MSMYSPNKSTKHSIPSAGATLAPESTDEAPIKVDGFGQVIALLQVADAAFRESLIARIAARDPGLARQIRATLARD